MEPVTSPSIPKSAPPPHRQISTATTNTDNRDSNYFGSFSDYLVLFQRQKRLLLFCALIGGLSGAGFAIFQRPVYRARTSLEVQDVNPEFMNLRQVSPVNDSGALGALSDLQTQMKLLQSTTLIDRTVANLKARRFSPSMPTHTIALGLRDALGVTGSQTFDSDKLLRDAAKSMVVTATGQTRIIELSVDSPDRAVASEFANTVTSEFLKQNMEARLMMTQYTSDWLAKQLQDSQGKLERSEHALQRYAQSNSLIYTSEKQNVSEEKLRQLQAELSRAQADRVSKQSRFEISRTSSADALPGLLNDTNLRNIQSTLTDLYRQHAKLSTTFKADFEERRKLQAQIVSLETALNRERQTTLERIGNEFNEAEHREHLLAAAYGEQAAVVNNDLQNSVQYNILKREVETNRQIFDAMLQRVKESSLASAMKSSNFRIIDAASLPDEPYKPSLTIHCAVGVICGLVLPLCLIIVSEHGNRKLRTPGDMSAALGLPELGTIPSGVNRDRSCAAPESKTVLAAHRSGNRQIELASWQEQTSSVADAVRNVLVSLMMTGSLAESAPVIAITSAGPREGKTMLSCNLAIALTLINKRVLLIDANFRNPALHRVFGRESALGFLDLIRLTALNDDLLMTALQEVGIPKLCVLTVGQSHGSAEESVFSLSLVDLMARFRTHFDAIIIDTPPLLRLPEARVFGHLADSVIFVARSGMTSIKAAVLACQCLSQDNTTILGVVLNDWYPGSFLGKYYPIGSRK